MPKTIETSSEIETARFAKAYANTASKGDVIFLQGNLGAGKSVFARAFIQGLTENAEENVPSPTFTLMQTYTSPRGEIYHYDLYRLKSAEEIYNLEWDEALEEGIVLVEWPERLGNMNINKPIKRITMKILKDGKRKITFDD